jgi:DNA-binding transcriptional LysR family regulator
MTLKQLQVFLAIAREQNFSSAARRINLSQPTLSEHVSELERELGTRLFARRRGSRTSPTEAGRVFEAYAARVVSTVADARRAIEEIDGLKRGSLIVGASTTPGIYLLPAVVGAFRARYPGIDLRLQIGNSRLIEERVRANEVDLGVVGGHELVPGERCLAAGLVDELMLVVPPRHPWLGRRRLAPTRLEEQPMLIREEGSATRRVMERALQQAGIAVRTGMELGHTEAIKQGVIAGLGVAFVSTYAIRGELATRRLHTVRLSGLRIQRHFHVIHNDTRQLSATARAFARLLDEEGRRLRV